jgi:hypothetical protein
MKMEVYYTPLSAQSWCCGDFKCPQVPGLPLYILLSSHKDPNLDLAQIRISTGDTNREPDPEGGPNHPNLPQISGGPW